MPNFIYDATGLPDGKFNLNPLPPGVNPNQWLVAPEWLTVMQAMYDVQGWARGAHWIGVTKLASDPAPVGIADYLWLRTDDTLMHNASPISGGGGGSVVTDGTTVGGIGTLGSPIAVLAGGIGTTQLAANAVTSAKIAGGAVGPTQLANTAVTPGAYTNVNLTVDQQGRITAISNGSAGSSVFIAGAGTGSAIQNNSTGNAATGANSTVTGKNNQLSGKASFAEGSGNVETVVSATLDDANHLEGVGNTIHVSLSGGGSANHVEGNGNTLTDNNSGNACDFNHVEGNQNTLSANGGSVEFNHVEGNQNTLTMTSGSELSYNHVQGNGNHLLTNGGDISFTHVEGNFNTVTSTTSDLDYSHIEGDHHTVTDADTTHVEGHHHTVSVGGGTSNHVEGNSNIVTGNGTTGNFVHVEGNNNESTASTTHVQGDGAKAIRETQHAQASGCFSSRGDAQHSGITLKGTTPGSAGSESVELKFGNVTANQTFQLEDGKAYLIEADVIAGGTQSGGSVRVCAGWKARWIARRASGLTTLSSPTMVGGVDFMSEATSSDWTFAASVAATPDRVKFLFTTGATASACHVVCQLKFTEVAF